MKILMLHRQPSAVGYYRSILPARALRKAGHEVTSFSLENTWGKGLKPNPADWLVQRQGEYDLIIVDRPLDWNDSALFAGYRHYSDGTRMIVDFDDDFTNVPWWNTAAPKYKPGQTFYEAGLMHLKLSEMTTVSTENLADTFRDKAHEISVAENFIDPEDWEDLPVNPERASDDALYILYGGAQGHFGDMDEAREGVEAVIRNPPCKTRLICFGSLPSWLHQVAREFPGRVLTLPWIPFRDYAKVIAWGGFDLAIAPLADHIFNDAKSNIKYLEAGIQGIPLICSDIGPYKNIPQGCAIKIDNTPTQWASALRNVMEDASLRKKLAKNAYEDVKENWTLEKRGKVWHDIVEKAIGLPRIENLADTRLESDPPPPPTVMPTAVGEKEVE